MRKISAIIITLLISVSSIIAQSNNDKARAHFTKAKSSYSSGSYSKTIESLNEAEQLLGKTNPVILNLKIKSYYYLKQFDEAKQCLNQFSKVSANADSKLKDETLSYIIKIDEAIKEEAIRKEKARLAEIKRKEDERLAEIKRKEDDKLADEKRKKDIERKRIEAISRNKKIFYDKVNSNPYYSHQEYSLKHKEVQLVNIREYGRKAVRYANFANSEGEIVLSIDKSNPLVSSSYGYRFRDFYEGMSAVIEFTSQTTSKCGYINMKGEKSVPFIYDVCSDFREDLAVVGKLTGKKYKRNGLLLNEIKYGYVNKNGNLILPMIYNHAGPFVNGKAKVRLFGKKKQFYINKNGEKIK